MAHYRIMYWYDIPYQVKAEDSQGQAKQSLPARFMRAINSAAIARAKYQPDAYSSGWHWGPKQSQEGSAKAVAAALAQELAERYSQEDLRQLLLGHARKTP